MKIRSLDKLNKFYLNSWWKTKKSVNEQVKIIKQVASDYGLKATIKIKPDKIGYNIYVKLNKK